MTFYSVIPAKQVLLANYLNDTWRSLILRDDQYIVSVFDRIHRDIPSESPVCLVHKIFSVGCALLQLKPEIAVSTPPERRLPSNAAYVNALRSLLLKLGELKARELLEPFFKREHACTGLRYEDLKRENPDEAFFSVEKKK